MITSAELPPVKSVQPFGDGLGDAIGGDAAAGAGNVLDHEGRAQTYRKPVGENARRALGERCRA